MTAADASISSPPARRGRTLRRAGLAALLAATALLARAPQAHANCNVIPGTVKSFAGQTGIINRPFSGPGENVELRLRSQCDGTTLEAAGVDHVVTVAFKPGVGVAPKLAVVAADCTGIETSCGATEVECFPTGAGCVADGNCDALSVDYRSGSRRLSFRFPATDRAGPAAVAVTPAAAGAACALATDTCAGLPAGAVRACIDTLSADTASCAGQPDPIFPHFTALPAANDFRAACFRDDPPCEASATELRFTADIDGNLLVPLTWASVLARNEGLPIPRLVRARVEAPLPIEVPDRRFLRSYSPEGGRLPPIFEPKYDPTSTSDGFLTIFGSVDAPASVLRLGRSFGVCYADPAAEEVCNVDADCATGGCAPRCREDPQTSCTQDADCASGPCGLFATDDVAGLVQAAHGGPLDVTRVALDVSAPQFCQEPVDYQACGGSAGTCTGDDDACVQYALEAETFVEFQGIEASEGLRTFVSNERVGLRDFNGDQDSFDMVITVRDRQTGRAFELGRDVPAGQCELEGGAFLEEFCRPREPSVTGPTGASLARGIAEFGSERLFANSSSTPNDGFAYPALAVEDDVVAFLESEQEQAQACAQLVIFRASCDLNEDGDSQDTILRIFQRTDAVASCPDGAPCLAERSPGREDRRRLRVPTLTPSIDERPLAISGGRIFVRTAEEMMSSFETETIHIRGFGDTGVANAVGTYELQASLSRDGRSLAFATERSGLVVSDNDDQMDVFLRDLSSGETILLSQDGEGSTPFVSADGTQVAFESVAGFVSGHRVIALYDVDTQAPPVVMPPTLQSGVHRAPALSASGRYVAFVSDAALVAEDTNGVFDVYVYDRDPDENGVFDEPAGSGDLELVSVGSDGRQGDKDSGFAIVQRWNLGPYSPEWFEERALQRPSFSDDGRYVAFTSRASTLVDGDRNREPDVFLRDRISGTTARVSLSGDGAELREGATFGTISGDGRTVAFVTGEDDSAQYYKFLLPVRKEVFLYDRGTGEREWIDFRGRPSGWPGELVSAAEAPLSLSADGRRVASGVTYWPGPDVISLFSSNMAWDRDRSRPVVFPSATEYRAGVISASGVVYAFYDVDGELVVRRPAPNQPGDPDDLLFDDDVHSDIVLEVVEASTGAITTLCPAGAVSVADGTAAFLRPESAAETGDACPAGSLNADSDLYDDVLHYWPGSGNAQSLGRAATAVDLGAGAIAALISEVGEGQDLNADGDRDDDVAARYDLSTSTWSETGERASRVAMAGAELLFVSTEDDAPILKRMDPTGGLASSGISVGDFVAGTPTVCPYGDEVHLVAMHEDTDLGAAQGYRGVGNLFVWDLKAPSGPVLYDTGLPAWPCQTEACDPRFPYRVEGGRVRLIVPEPVAFTDLNGDTDRADLVVVELDFCAPAARALARKAGRDPIPVPSCLARPLGESTAERSAGSDPTRTIEESVVLESRAGRCVATRADVACDPNAGAATQCLAGEFCDAATWSCAKRQPGSCRPGNDDCPANSVCRTGVCLGSGGGACNIGVAGCEVGEACIRGNCHDLDPPACTDDGDCDPGKTCTEGAVTAGVAVTREAQPLACEALLPGLCSRTPRANCETTDRAMLNLQDLPNRNRNRLAWRWGRGSDSEGVDFGDPTSSDAYALCIYDTTAADDRLRFEARAPYGRECGQGGNQQGCWRLDERGAGASGFAYVDRSAEPDGLRRIHLLPGRRIDVKGAGANLDMPDLDTLQAPLKVQLQGSHGICFEATFSEIEVRNKNQGRRLKAVSD